MSNLKSQIYAGIFKQYIMICLAFFLLGAFSVTPVAAGNTSGYSSTVSGTTEAESAGCPAYPAFPDAGCTGWQHTGVTLTPYTGPTTITTAGTVIDSKQINSSITIAANNVTIKRSEVNGQIFINGSTRTGVLVEDVKINAGNVSSDAAGQCIGGSSSLNGGATAADFIIRRVDMEGCGQGAYGRGFTLEDSYIHDLYGSGETHNEAVLGHSGDLVIRHNTLIANFNAQSTGGGMSAVIALYTHSSFWPDMDNTVVEKNYMETADSGAGWAGYCFYGGNSPDNSGDASNTYYFDNVFARGSNNVCGQYGPFVYLPSGGNNCWSNNRYSDGTSISSSLPICTTPPTTDTEAPTTPTNLTATAQSASSIALTWSPSTDNTAVTGYDLYRCQGTSCTPTTLIASPTGTSFTDTGLAAETAYRYRVQAKDTAENLSGYSNVISATTLTSGASGWPDATITGVPEGTELTPYTGPCTIAAANTVIDARSINCGVLLIDAPNVTITRSRINGGVAVNGTAGVYDSGNEFNSLVITDSEIIGPTTTDNAGGTGLGEMHWYARRIEITGFRRSAHCLRECSLEDSYLHGQANPLPGFDFEPIAVHQSALRAGPNTLIRGNTIVCDTPDLNEAGCSANLTIYGEWGQSHDITVDNNYFPASPSGYCVYGGDTHGRNDAYNIKYTNNVFGRRGPDNFGASQHTESGGYTCGYYGTVSSFNLGSGHPGNEWTDNTYYPDGGAAAYDRSGSPSPAITFNASPASIENGQSATLIWSATDATSCQGTNFTTGGATNGSATVAPATDTIYTIDCAGAGGTASDSVTVSVTSGTVFACSDGLDNDTDGLTDYPADPGCTSATDDDETDPVVDTTPPSDPSGLNAAAVSHARIDLTWTASSDNTAVAGYKVFRDSVEVMNINGTSCSDTGLDPETTYSYTVSAYDAAGNESGPSAAAEATTQASTSDGDGDGDGSSDDGSGGGSSGGGGGGCFVFSLWN